jgi:hypothetical protein
VYISRDVVFDETIFPFQYLHTSAGALLRKEILLLPNHLRNPDCGGVSCNDHLPTDTTNDAVDEACVQEVETSEVGDVILPSGDQP